MLFDDPYAPVDNYCERLDPSFWAEPLNAASNAAFLLAAGSAFALWRRSGGRDLAVLWLIAVTGAVGIGSFLFHTLANRWSLLADVLPIGVFIYSYFLIAMRRFLGLGGPVALGLTLAFFGFSLVFERLWVAAVGPDRLNGSIGYVPAALAMLAVGATLRLVGAGSRPSARIRARRRAGGALLLAAACFALSLGLRTIDERVCPAMPAGTHMFWHVLNALVLFQLMRSALAFGRTAPPKDPPSFSQDRG